LIQIKINERVFLKDPDTSDLGRKIVEQSVAMIDEMGFEDFTFRKLANRISSTEASIYRYFENKHKLLIYLVSWYWNWLEYQLDFLTSNVEEPEQQLRLALRTIAQPHLTGVNHVHINKEALHRIVVAESPKAYLNKEVDTDNKEGYFMSYKRLCGRIAQIARKVNPDYPYATALVSTLIESAHHQVFFAAHLPRLTEVENGNYERLTSFLVDTAFRVLKSGVHYA
jgi:AcrR family transcriptional regulator